MSRTVVILSAAVRLAYLAANAIYAKRHGMMSPADIKLLRKELGLKQDDLATFMDAGKTVISRWESGVILQPNIADRMLHILKSHPGLLAEYVGVDQLHSLDNV